MNHLAPQSFTVSAAHETGYRPAISETFTVYAEGGAFLASSRTLGISKKYATPEQAIGELLRAAGMTSQTTIKAEG